MTVDLSPGTHRSLDTYIANVNSGVADGAPRATKAGVIRGLIGSRLRGEI